MSYAQKKRDVRAQKKSLTLAGVKLCKVVKKVVKHDKSTVKQHMYSVLYTIGKDEVTRSNRVISSKKNPHRMA